MRPILRVLIPAIVVLAAWLAWPYLEPDNAQVRKQSAGLLVEPTDVSRLAGDVYRWPLQ